jgi:hypothetical protein
VFALRAPTKELVTTIAERCDRLGSQHTQVWHYPGYGAGLDIPDPDRTLVRILWHDPHRPSGFLGVAFDAEGRPEPYRQPRLDLGGESG